jgi:hypothetical protein
MKLARTALLTAATIALFPVGCRKGVTWVDAYLRVTDSSIFITQDTDCIVNNDDELAGVPFGQGEDGREWRRVA